VHTRFEQLLHGDISQLTSSIGLHPEINGQLPIRSKLLFRIAIPVHPISGEVGG